MHDAHGSADVCGISHDQSGFGFWSPGPASPPAEHASPQVPTTQARSASSTVPLRWLVSADAHAFASPFPQASIAGRSADEPRAVRQSSSRQQASTFAWQLARMHAAHAPLPSNAQWSPPEMGLTSSTQPTGESRATTAATSLIRIATTPLSSGTLSAPVYPSRTKSCARGYFSQPFSVPAIFFV